MERHISEHGAIGDEGVSVPSSATHLMMGFGSGLLEHMDRLLPAKTLVVVEEPDVVTARRVLKRCQAYACFAGLLQAPIHDERAVSATVAALPALPAVQVVVPGVEYGVVAAAALAERMKLPGAGLAAARAFRSKIRLRATAERAGIPQPRWRAVTDAAEADRARRDFSGRCVLKPADRQGSLGVLLLGPDDDMTAAWAHVSSAEEAKVRTKRKLPKEFLVEERLDGPEVSVECLVARGSVLFLNVTAKSVFHGTHPVENGHVVPAPLEPGVRALLTDAMTALIRATGFDSGILHAEWILVQGRPALIECAGRLPGDGIKTMIDHAYGGSIVSDYLSVLGGADTPCERSAVQAAAVRFLAPPPGVLHSVEGISKAEGMPGVVEVRITAEPGTDYGDVTSSFDRAGHVMALGVDPEEAWDRVQAAADVVTMVSDADA